MIGQQERRIWAVALVFGTLAASPALAAAPVVPATALGPQSVASLAARLSPAVVNISSTHHVANGSGVPFPKAPQGSQLQQLFDDNNPDAAPDGQIPEGAESLGSGFIISADGLIVTNNHVISGADDVQVYLTDGTRLPAKIVGTDLKTDLAVLRVAAKKPLPFVQFGDSEAAEVGDWVMAIGNPFGLGGSVTLGIISARNRDIQSGPYDSYIQTDASINQGNSGGPLFDMNGRVVGINTAIIAEGGSSLGIGFAIPGSLAQPVVQQLAQYGRPRRGWLGVGIQDVSEDIAAALGRADTHGAMVTDVANPGPSAGVLDEGDIITTFDGHPVDTMHDLPRLVAETSAGKAVALTVVRADKPRQLTVTVGLLKDEQPALVPASADVTKLDDAKPSGTTLEDLLGLTVAPISDSNRKIYALQAGTSGLVITTVKAGSDADDKGLIPGFVVAEANEQKVSTPSDLQAVLDQAVKAGRTALLFKIVDPAGERRFIAVKLPG